MAGTHTRRRIADELPTGPRGSPVGLLARTGDRKKPVNRRVVGDERGRALFGEGHAVDLVARPVRDQESVRETEVEVVLCKTRLSERGNLDRSSRLAKSCVPVEGQPVATVVVGQSHEYDDFAPCRGGQASESRRDRSLAKRVEIGDGVPAGVGAKRGLAAGIGADDDGTDRGAHRRAVPAIVIRFAGGEHGPEVGLRSSEDILEVPGPGKTKVDPHFGAPAEVEDRTPTHGDRALDDDRALRLRFGGSRGDDRASAESCDQPHHQRRSDARMQGAAGPSSMALAWLVFALALVGCGPTRPQPVSERPPIEVGAFGPASAAVEQPFVLQNGWIRGSITIPAGVDRGSPRPAVINPVVDPAALLERGIVVVRYRPHWGALPRPPRSAARAEPGSAGEKDSAEKPVGVWLFASPSPRVIGQAYFRLIWASGAAAATVVRHLATVEVIDAERIGMAGISTNGFKVYSALFAGTPLRAAVIVGACGDYHSFLQDSPVALAGGELDLEPDYEGWLVEREPVSRPESLIGTALLLVNGGKDHVIPTDCVERSSAVLRPAYEAAGATEKFRQVWMPDATHNELVGEGTEDILSWWERWLR